MGIELARLQGAFAAYQKQLGARTQSNLGAEIHVQQSTVSNWLRGARSVPAEKVPELAKALGCSTDYLFGLTDQPAPDPNARGAGEYTGLSPAAISALHNMETAPFIADYTKMALEGFSMPDSAADVKTALSRLLCMDEMQQALASIEPCKEARRVAIASQGWEQQEQRSKAEFEAAYLRFRIIDVVTHCIDDLLKEE